MEWRDIDGEIVALALEELRYMTLKGTGALLWRRLADGTTAHELVQLLSDRYGIDRERAAGDVDAFLTELRARGLLSG